MLKSFEFLAGGWIKKKTPNNNKTTGRAPTWTVSKYRVSVL